MFTLIASATIVCTKPQIVKYPDGMVMSSIECQQKPEKAKVKAIEPKSKVQGEEVYGNIPENFTIPKENR